MVATYDFAVCELMGCHQVKMTGELLGVGLRHLSGFVVCAQSVEQARLAVVCRAPHVHCARNLRRGDESSYETLKGVWHEKR